MENKKNLKTPFFANFLENQMSADETNGVQGGITNRTLDTPHTEKYPSDKEGDVTSTYRDNMQTMKYPSDNEEFSSNEI